MLKYSSENSKKIFIKNQTTWAHHRSGWSYVINNLKKLHNKRGVLFNGFLEEIFYLNKPIKKPFVGVFHNVPFNNTEGTPYDEKYKDTNLDYFMNDGWDQCEKKCRGIFVFSNFVANYLKTKTNVPISVLYHPTEFVRGKFSYETFAKNKNKKLLFIGHWMRNYHPFFELKAENYKRIVLVDTKNKGTEIDRRIIENLSNPDVQVENFISNEDYDYCLTQNIVFLNLFSASANNIVIECMVRNTPLLINKLDAIVEYLGEEYPFYYNDIEEANLKLKDFELIEKTNNYLINLSTTRKLSIYHFMQSFINSTVYEQL